MAVNPFNINEAIETIQQDAGPDANGSKLVTLGGDHTIALPLLRAAAERAGARCHAALRRPPGHLGHLLRCRVHARHPVPPRRRRGHSGHGGHQPRRHPRPALRQERPRRRPPLRLRHRHLRGRLLPGRPETVAKIRDRIGNRPLYISVDIDVLDPAHAPGTGTPEAGGITAASSWRSSGASVA